MAERGKQNEFAKNVEKYGFTYERFALIPFVLETPGAWGPKAKKFWRVLMGIFKSEVAERRVPGSLLNHKDHKSECTWNAFTLNCLFPIIWQSSIKSLNCSKFAVLLSRKNGADEDGMKEE